MTAVVLELVVLFVSVAVVLLIALLALVRKPPVLALSMSYDDSVCSSSETKHDNHYQAWCR